MLGKMNDNQIINVLQSNMIGRLVSYAKEKLYCVPITYAYKDGHIYCNSKEGLKVELMGENAQVCFEVDDILQMNDWRCVILWGEYESLKDSDHSKAMQIINDRIGPYTTGETVVPYIRQEVPHAFRIKIKEQSGRYEKPGP